MRYCEKCGFVMDEFDADRNKQNCPICSGIWTEDDMTAIRYAELSESEKDNYDEQLLKNIKSSPNFDESSHQNCSTIDGSFWGGFRIEKMARIYPNFPKKRLAEIYEERKGNEPFKPFPPIDNVKAREVALDAEIAHQKVESGYYNKKSTQENNIPKCPVCQSTNLSKISTLKKATKVGLFGIFGAGDLGKTWKCNSCGSRF